MSAVSPRRGYLPGANRLALPVRNFRRSATRMTVSIGAAVLVVMAPVAPVWTASASSTDVPPPDKTALIMGATTIPTPDEFWVQSVMNQFIAPTHPDQTIKPVAVTTPEEGWPLTGLARLLFSAFGPPNIWGPGSPAWPDEPWWKLSGLFDLTFDQSVQAGVADLETAMAVHGNDDLVIYGYSQGATVAIQEKRKLAAQYPWGTKAPDIDFVLGGDGNLPNGGFLARFPGLYIPILDWSFNGPEPTDTQFDTVVITRQYDASADFPLYPLNLVADLNALLGFLYVHLYAFDVSLAPDPSTSTPFQDTHGDTSYYFFKTQDLPLFDPLRTLGMPEPVIDVVEPFFRVLVELGYDRSIPPWEPTPARLIPTLDPAKVTADLLNAIGEGINNAGALFGLPPLLSIPAAPGTDTAPADTFRQAASMEQMTESDQTSRETATQTDQVTLTEAGTHTNPVTSTKTRTETDQMTSEQAADTGQAASETGTGTGQVTLTDAGTQTNPVTSTKTRTDQVTSRRTATATQPNQDASTPPNAVESSTTLSTSLPGKHADTPTRGPAERGTVGAFGQQNHGLPHRGDGDQPRRGNVDQPTNRTAAVGKVNTTRGPAPSSSSPSTGSFPESNSPGGDGDGS